MNVNERTGILVVGHGSRREEANEDVRAAARRIGERGGFNTVEAAFLEITTPTIRDGFAKLYERGARRITVMPYFLSPGRHTRGDLPVEVRAAADEFEGVTFRIAEPLCGHDFVVDACVDRIREARRRDDPFRLTRRERGKVFLVGAGPGDPGLLTVKARDLLRRCDTVVYDYLVNEEILDVVLPDAEKIYVGKVGGGRQTPQSEINDLLVRRALRGEKVVRLKGGDPFIFGRGGEEAEALREAEIPFEIVPGVSSAVAAPAYAGIPLTHRDHASSFAVVSGVRAGDGEFHSHRIGKVAGADTVVVLMGASHIREITADFIRAGRTPETPAAIIRWGTFDDQQVVTGTLATLADEVARRGVRAPSVIVVGDVVSLRDRLAWFETATAENRSETPVLANVSGW